MNCAECRDNLVACLEGLLEPEQHRQCHAHLDACEACRADYAAFAQLQQRLVASGQVAASVALVEPVMRQVRSQTIQSEKVPFMRIFLNNWRLGTLGAATAAILMVVLLTQSQATPAEVLARGAKAVARLTSIHLRGQLRTLPGDNFAHLDVTRDFAAIELWKVFDGGYNKWRVEKPGRVAVMDGQSTVMWIRPPMNYAVKYGPARSAFDTDWLHRIANLSATITDELNNARARGWPMHLEEQTGADGRRKAIVTIQTSSGLPENDYLKNKFVDLSDSRRVYWFDAGSELLEGVQVYVRRPAGDVLVFEVTEISYNREFEAAVFQLDLPENVTWDREMQVLPDNEKYASMTAEQAARAFFEACGRKDWTEVEKFSPSLTNARFREYLGGLEVLKIGDSFTSQGYPGQFVPYEIKLTSEGVKKHNLALKKDPRTGRWFVDGGI